MLAIYEICENKYEIIIQPYMRLQPKEKKNIPYYSCVRYDNLSHS